MAVHAYQLYLYNPSLAAAVIFAVLFGIVTAGHIFLVLRRRSFFFIPFVVGGIFETVGYAARGPSHNNTQLLGAYVIQSVLILVAPALFAASIYMTLGRAIRAVHGESYSPIRVTWLTKAFVTADVFCFFLQAGGGGVIAQGNPTLGKGLIVGGLFLQLVAFGLFVLTLVVFWTRTRHHGAQPKEASGAAVDPFQVLRVLFAVSLLILARSVVRVVEYIIGQGGYLLSHEWILYVFDATLMFMAMVVLLVWHPTRIDQSKAQDVGLESRV